MSLRDDPAVDAMNKVRLAMKPLTENEEQEVIVWFVQRYTGGQRGPFVPSSGPKPPAASQQGNQS